jgi:hypothetical protein
VDELILEGVVVTLNLDGSPNIAPMGPRVDRDITRLVLRPFRTSQTYQNLKRQPEGVLHVTDDVELIARAAIGQPDPLPPLVPLESIRVLRLADCCRWFAFRVTALDDADERTTIQCRVVERGTVRDFFGLNRAKHAVLEAAILATRIGILPADEIRSQLQRLAPLVQKTAGDQERRAFALLDDYIGKGLHAERPSERVASDAAK